MSESNPYAPPRADVQFTPKPVEVPASVGKKIKGAWVAGLVSAAATLVFSLFGIQGFDMMNLLDVGLILAMSYGIYRKSRASAVAMLVYFIVSKALIIAESGKVDRLFLGLVFLFFYWQGVAGTYQYKKLLKSARPSS
jgi:hypothetical protein